MLSSILDLSGDVINLVIMLLNRVGEILLEDASGHAEPPGRTIPVGLVLQDPDSQVIAARVGDDVAFGR